MKKRKHPPPEKKILPRRTREDVEDDRYKLPVAQFHRVNVTDDYSRSAFHGHLDIRHTVVERIEIPSVVLGELQTPRHIEMKVIFGFPPPSVEIMNLVLFASEPSEVIA